MMKLEVIQENLAKALSMAKRIVGVRSTLPILNNVLLKTEKGKLRLSATDLEVGITVWIGAKIEKEGSFTLPAKLFGDYIAAGTGKTIHIEQGEGMLKISDGQGEAAIKGLPADEFPVIPELTGTPLLSLPPILSKEVMRRADTAADADDPRPTPAGVLLWKTG